MGFPLTLPSPPGGGGGWENHLSPRLAGLRASGAAAPAQLENHLSPRLAGLRASGAAAPAQLENQRSTSPKTGSTEPMMATTSATLCPGMMWGNSARLEKEAPRHFIR